MEAASNGVSAWITPAIVAALIAGLVNAIGWFVAYGRDRRLDVVKRQEKVRDYMTALRAEIRCHNRQWSEGDAAQHKADMIRLINTVPSYTPFIPREPSNVVFAAILSEIHILPAEAIEPVVRFYWQTQSIAQLVEDLRGEGFKALDAGRKATLYSDYIDLQVEAGRLAEGAVSALNAWRGGS
jgi:hypothetical protein